jgi:hypothetical protein
MCGSSLTVQALLGHKFVDTTLGYARLYDGTIAADYYWAMAQVEKQLDLQPGAEVPGAPAQSKLLSELAGWTLEYKRAVVLRVCNLSRVGQDRQHSLDPDQGAGAAVQVSSSRPDCPSRAGFAFTCTPLLAKVI